MAMKNRSESYNANGPTPKNGLKYIKYKMCHIIMMLICIKQHIKKHMKLSS